VNSLCIPLDQCSCRDGLAIKVYEYLKNENFCSLLSDEEFLKWMSQYAGKYRKSFRRWKSFLKICRACRAYIEKHDFWMSRFASASEAGGTFFVFLFTHADLASISDPNEAIMNSYNNLVFYIGLLALDKKAASATSYVSGLS